MNATRWTLVFALCLSLFLLDRAHRAQQSAISTRPPPECWVLVVKPGAVPFIADELP